MPKIKAITRRAAGGRAHLRARGQGSRLHHDEGDGGRIRPAGSAYRHRAGAVRRMGTDGVTSGRETSSEGQGRQDHPGSVALHVVVLGWGCCRSRPRRFEMPPPIAAGRHHLAQDLAKVMAGLKTGQKENPKPLVEKVAEPKPVEEPSARSPRRKPVMTETAPPPQPKVEEKPARRSPTRRRVAESRRKSRSRSKKPIRRRSIRSTEALRRKKKKPPPKPVQAEKPPSRRSRRCSNAVDRPDADRGACSTSATRRARPRPATR